MRLDAVDPFDGAGLLDFLAPRCVPGIDEVDGRSYRRRSITIAVDDRGADLEADGRRPPPDVVARARRLLDIDVDPTAVAATLRADPVLAPLVAAAPGLRVPGAWDPFEVLVRAVVGQQVTVAAARTLLGRVVARCDGVLTPDALAAADLDGIGMPGSRVATLRAIAGVDPTDTAALRTVRGIGPWTIGYVGLRTGDRDAFPIGDAGLRIAAGRLGLPTVPKALAAHAERWRPYRAYATLHLWRTLA